ncbi:MAG: NADPH-dependent 7-cyano-7-deazaguanine reductase QueF [Candidatus Eutrophobiaceae bacterium]
MEIYGVVDSWKPISSLFVNERKNLSNQGMIKGIDRQALWRTYGFERIPWRHAVDVWTAWELSWLDSAGLPQVMVGILEIPGDSPRLAESKSLKNRFFSLNQRSFPDPEAFRDFVVADLSECIGAPVNVRLLPVDDLALAPAQPLGVWQGTCLDKRGLRIENYDCRPELLCTEDRRVTETLYSHLLRTNCPLTGQPDWASIYIHYSGRAMAHAALLRYLISFRNHKGFAEPVAERIFLDIFRHCAPETLAVCCRYLRRGGLDINSLRSTGEIRDFPPRILRQ